MKSMNSDPQAPAAAGAEAGLGTDRPRREALNERRVWHVYARRRYDEPLHEIGNVVADDVELARVYARSIYDEFTWIEMVLVPRDCIVTVIAP
jgi:hypothetical protein